MPLNLYFASSHIEAYLLIICLWLGKYFINVAFQYFVHVLYNKLLLNNGHFHSCVWLVFTLIAFCSFVVQCFVLCWFWCLFPFICILFSWWVYFVMSECWNGMFSNQGKFDVLSIISLTFSGVVPQTSGARQPAALMVHAWAWEGVQ